MLYKMVKNDMKLMHKAGFFYITILFWAIILVIQSSTNDFKLGMLIIRPYISFTSMISITLFFFLQNDKVIQNQIILNGGLKLRMVSIFLALSISLVILSMTTAVFLFFRNELSLGELVKSLNINIYYNSIAVCFFIAINMLITNLCSNKYIGLGSTFMFWFYSINTTIEITFLPKIFLEIENDNIFLITLFFFITILFVALSEILFRKKNVYMD